MNAGKKLQIFVCILLVSCKSSEEKTSADDRLSEFYGTFKGAAESVNGGELSERELTVVIKPWEDDKGFTIEWTTQIYRSNGKDKYTDMAINFYPSQRPNIYLSALRTDIFGKAVPLDPGEEDQPYVWAGMKGNTLTVSALYITEGGGHELQVYERSSIEEGLLLQFERLSNGEKVAEISALLNRVE